MVDARPSPASSRQSADGVRRPDGIDGRWLSSALGEVGIGGGADIVAVTATSIGTGQVGHNVRFTLTWSDDDPSLPGSVVGKFPSDDPDEPGSRRQHQHLRS